jgi:hydrogenase expression/formation protein HypE
MKNKDFQLSCPMPLKGHPRILLGHGSGGSLMHELIEKVFAPEFDNPLLRQAHDGAVMDWAGKRAAITTDSYVVHPLFFPGGDIGKLAVYGSVNDLAMCGARPLYLTASFILEEGFEIALLCRIVRSMKEAAKKCRVSIITGDTKVVDKGKGDGVFINTTGFGVVEHDLKIVPRSIRKGDAIVLSGDIGRHGMAIMASREGLTFETEIQSDAAPLAESVLKLIKRGIPVHCLRDLTRGGLATALVELAGTSGYNMLIREQEVSVRPEVRGACEILGLDPLYVANEGRFICFVPEKDVTATIKVLQKYPGGNNARCIGQVLKEKDSRVMLENAIGTTRVLNMLPGQLLPRIC